MNYVLAPFVVLLSILMVPPFLLGWNGGYVRYVLVAVAFAILIALSVVGFRRRDANARPRLRVPVVLIPAIWIFIVIWGLALSVPPGSQIHRSSWVTYVPTAAVSFSLIASTFFIIYQRGSRVFLICYSIVNIWLTISAFLIAAMQVTGTWI